MQLFSWLRSKGYQIGTLNEALDDASSRRYFRININGQSMLAVDDPPPQKSVDDFLDRQQRLNEAGVRVPQIYEFNGDDGFMLVEDFGRQHYFAAIQSQRSNQFQHTLYRRAIESMTHFQRHTDCTQMPHYTAAFLKQEMALFPEWYAKVHLNHELSPQQRNDYDQIIDLCVTSATEQPTTFVHRDYHSRNLMVIDDDLPGTIDFQGALYGPLTYDCVSLLKDCYIDWPEVFLQKYCEQHRQSLPETVSRRQYQRWFDLMGLQRHLKVLGIFARLHDRDGKARYLKDIPLVRLHIERIIPRYPELQPLAALMHDLHQ